MPKLAVSNKVIVPIKFSMQDGKKTVPFKFSLVCDRLTIPEWQERVKGEDGFITNEKIKETLTEITTGWEGQNFVLEDDGTPSEFNEENLALMYDATGVIDLVLASYLKESAARAKN